MSQEAIALKLKAIHQEHLLKQWDGLNEEEKEKFARQVESLNLNLFLQQKSLLQKHENISEAKIDPFLDYSYSGNNEDFKTGQKLISQGKVGCLLIAGGQGTRLGFNGPKGLFPITPLTKKSLFQFCAEKVVAASKKYGRQLPLAIMTSPLNDALTRNFFESNQLFGLHQEQLSFFVQGVLPFLDQEGNLFMEEAWKLAEGPDGNGYSLHHFVHKEVWKKWQIQGIEYVNYILIDNPLADPFDAELIGFHHRKKADVTLKCVKRRDLNEKVGIVVKKENKVRVIEYSEISQEERTACLKDGSFKHPCANLSLFCFNMSFINKTANQILPLHKSLKKAKKLNERTDFFAWKFESFIFDHLPYAEHVQALVYPREECFAPLKNATGEDSPLQVQKALEKQAKERYLKMTGKLPELSPFELPIDDYY